MMPITSNRSFSLIVNDVVAGMVVFFVALPLCLGVANASRAENLPDALNTTILSGIIAGIIGGIVVGLISNSHTSVSGPAAGLTAVVGMQIANIGSFQGFLVALTLAGIIQVILGMLRYGSLAEFFPASVIKGLLTAIGVILILKQIPHLLGHDKDPEGEFSFFQPDQKNTFTELIDIVYDYDAGAMLIGLSSLLLLLIWDRIKWLKRSLIPPTLVVVLWGILCYLVFNRLGGAWTIAPVHAVRLPTPDNPQDFLKQLTAPDFSILTSGRVYMAAFAIAIVASLETLLNRPGCGQYRFRAGRRAPHDLGDRAKFREHSSRSYVETFHDCSRVLATLLCHLDPAISEPHPSVMLGGDPCPHGL